MLLSNTEVESERPVLRAQSCSFPGTCSCGLKCLTTDIGHYNLFDWARWRVKKGGKWLRKLHAAVFVVIGITQVNICSRESQSYFQDWVLRKPALRPFLSNVAYHVWIPPPAVQLLYDFCVLRKPLALFQQYWILGARQWQITACSKKVCWWAVMLLKLKICWTLISSFRLVLR